MVEDRRQAALLAQLQLTLPATPQLRRVVAWRAQAGVWRDEERWAARHVLYQPEHDLRPAPGDPLRQLQLQVFLSKRTPEELALIAGRLDGLSDRQIASQLYAREVAQDAARARVAQAARRLRDAAVREL